MSDRLAALEAKADALLASDRITAPTRRALMKRLEPSPDGPSVLSARQRHVLEAVAERLVPLGGLRVRVGLAERFDVELATGPGDGWRYAETPPEKIAVAGGLDALDAGGFVAADGAGRDAHLARVRAGEVENWATPPARWFEEVLAALVRLAYAHPLVQLDIGYDGMADARGVQDLDDPPR